jgi:hypothetical protein
MVKISAGKGDVIGKQVPDFHKHSVEFFAVVSRLSRALEAGGIF